MERYTTHFRREPGGAWTCISHTEIRSRLGRVQVAAGSRFEPGTTFMGVDIVQLLEQEFARINVAARPATQLLAKT